VNKAGIRIKELRDTSIADPGILAFFTNLQASVFHPKAKSVHGRGNPGSSAGMADAALPAETTAFGRSALNGSAVPASP
jgi:hypothetical protein